MERKTALAKLQKRLGKGFAWRENKGWRPKEEREAAFAEFERMQAEYTRLGDEMERLRRRILAEDGEYQNLLAARKTLSGQKDRVAGTAHTKRFTVGTANSLFFHVAADGDSWEEVFAELDKREGKK